MVNQQEPVLVCNRSATSQHLPERRHRQGHCVLEVSFFTITFTAFFICFSSSAFVTIFTPIPLHSLFLVESNSLAVNVGRIFELAGLTLVLTICPMSAD
jgi:hypothetical protein